MLLAADVGGTKTLIGLFEPAGPSGSRPRELAHEEFVTLDYEGLESIVSEFLRRQDVSAGALRTAAVGVAGAVTDQVGQLTNVPWVVSAASLKSALRLERVQVLNDLEALACAVPVLSDDELEVLQKGTRVQSGNIAVIAAGTGLGESMLLNVDGRLHPGESEGGHADFAARTPRELEMVRVLTPVLGRVSAEAVLSGPGLVNVYQFTHDAITTAPFVSPGATWPSHLCDGVGDVEDLGDLPARIYASASARRCPQCVEALEIFVGAYGAEAGNLALRTVATAGVYIGGGIAPRILPALRTAGFIDAFRDKAPMQELVSRIPVSVILNPTAGLLGAAVRANGLL